jgi:hypothetical protein
VTDFSNYTWGVIYGGVGDSRYQHWWHNSGVAIIVHMDQQIFESPGENLNSKVQMGAIVINNTSSLEASPWRFASHLKEGCLAMFAG